MPKRQSPNLGAAFSDISSVKPRKIEFNPKKKDYSDTQFLYKNDRIPLIPLSTQASRKPATRTAKRQEVKMTSTLKSNELFNKYPLKKTKENTKPKSTPKVKVPVRTTANNESSFEAPSMRCAVPQPEIAEPRPAISNRHLSEISTQSPEIT